MKQLKTHIIFFFLFLFSMQLHAQGNKTVVLAYSGNESRVLFGIGKINEALKQIGYKIISLKDAVNKKGEKLILVDTAGTEYLEKHTSIPASETDSLGKEGYLLKSFNDVIVVTAKSASGLLYGCLRLAEKIASDKKLPFVLGETDKPQMVLRGTCIGLQKTTYLPGRNVYEYPYTPETFPWFYDKKLWIQYLDSMLANRFNSLYLWNGHPFASLVKLKDYPYAVEVDDATFKKNEEIYRFITTEADKRGIWVIQMFYNIIVSKPFAEKNNLKTQDRERPIIPLISDYTRKSIAAFVEKYPNVGLMVCLGEAMEGTGNDDIEWFTKTIIPGVKDGLAALGKKEEPPIVLRAHDTDAPSVMKAAMPLYHNLYTEAKFNGEALTTYQPRGSWAALHQTLSHIGTVQIENVHIMANLEPFRYAAASFIQKSVQGMHSIMGGNGLHLYPQASYWDWPYTADKVPGRLLEFERDWLWYKQWGRYSWNCNRDSIGEKRYWSQLLAKKFGCSESHGAEILNAFEESGEIAPKLLRRFGITDGNRQTLTLGMLMNQLTNPERYGLFTLLYDSESPEGESLSEYAAKEWKKQKHVGETPVQIIGEVKVHGEKATASVNKAAPFVTKNKKEFERIFNDIQCYRLLADHYAAKAGAALDVLHYKYSKDIADLRKAKDKLEESLRYYKELAKRTDTTYLYANSMQTQQRKIPIRGVDGKFKTWSEVLVPFQQELDIFKKKIDSIYHTGSLVMQKVLYARLEPADVKIESRHDGSFNITKGERVFSDSLLLIDSADSPLGDLQGLRFSMKQQQLNGTTISFTSIANTTLLVGYFVSKDKRFLKEPELETNAAANDYGQADIKIANAMIVEEMPPLNVHAYSFGPGKHELHLGKGICLVLGFVKGDEKIPVYDAALNDPGKTNVDWLFE